MDQRGQGRAEFLAFFAKKVTALTAALAGVIGLATGALSLFFLMRPNLAPSTTNRAAITEIAVEPRVTLQDYLSHFSVQMTLLRIQNALPKANQPMLMKGMSPRFKTVGTVIHFGIEMDGLHGRRIGERWSVFDADTGTRAGDSEQLDPLPLDFDPEKKADSGTWEIWVDTSNSNAHRIFVRIELYDEQGGSGITFKDTPVFPRPE
jgi:hypothetical protein